MAKYKEVYEKQLELSKLADRDAPLNKSAFVGFTYRFCNSLVRLNLDTQRELLKGKKQEGDLNKEEERMACSEQCFDSAEFMYFLMDAYAVRSIAE